MYGIKEVKGFPYRCSMGKGSSVAKIPRNFLVGFEKELAQRAAGPSAYARPDNHTGYWVRFEEHIQFGKMFYLELFLMFTDSWVFFYHDYTEKQW